MLLGLIALSFSSCYQEFPDPSNSKNYVNINASISQISTRATGTSWSDGDAIGIYMKKAGETLSETPLASNIKYVTDGSESFNPAYGSDALSFPFDKSNVDFISYYPYKSDISGLIYPIDISNQSNLAAIDFLYASATSFNSESPNVSLSFKHQLSMINLNITTTDIPDLTTLKARIVGAPTKASFSLVDGVISNLVEKDTINLNINDPGTAVEGLLIPTTDLTGITLELLVDSIIYRFKLDEGTKIIAFDKSTKYTYNVKLSSKVGVILGASIEDWITGEIEEVEIKGESVTPDIVIPPVEPDEPQLPPSDKGTQENPYTVEEALLLTDSIIDNVWLEGYYVGDYTNTGSTELTFNGVGAMNGRIAIASAPNEVDTLKIFPVLTLSANFYLFNIKAIPENRNKNIIIYGDFINGSLKDGAPVQRICMSYVEKVIINGVTYTK